MEQNVKAIIFDMDGILLDSETISWRTWEIAAKEKGLPDIEKTNAVCMGRNRADTVSILKEIYGKDFDALALLERTSALFDEIEQKEGIPLMPYAKETLSYLSKKYILALASSTRGFRVRRQLKNAGILEYFKTLTTGDMVSHSKPDPEIYKKAAYSIGIKEEKCIAVEDSPNGVKSATSALIKTIMIPDKIQPTEELTKLCWKVCKNLSELKLFL